VGGQAFGVGMTKNNIKSRFKTTRIWPLLPMTTDDKTKSNGVYIAKPSPNISNDDTSDSNNVVDEDQWGEDGVVI
jgi:hypothetical protein